MKLFSKITAIVLALLTVAGAVYFSNGTAKAESTIDELREEIDYLNNQLDDLEAWKDQAHSDKTAALKKIQGIDAQKVVIQKQIDVSLAILDEIDAELERLDEKLKKQEAELEDFKDLYGQRVRANYEAGQTSYLEVLLSAGSFSDYLTRIDLVEQIMEYDNSLIDKMKAAIKSVNETIEQVEKTREDQQEAQDELDAQMADLDAKEAEQYAIVEQLTADEKRYKKEMEAAEEALNESLKELDKIIAESANGEGPSFLSWPVPGQTLITDYWGWRADPFGGGGSVWHNGIDVGCDTGTPIYAPASGTVIECYWSDAIGNVLIIDHGGGLSTRYYHLSDFAVSVGDVVERGQLVAYVGNTGYYTTGPHLHFEVRLYSAELGYSESVDPFGYTTPS